MSLTVEDHQLFSNQPAATTVAVKDTIEQEQQQHSQQRDY